MTTNGTDASLDHIQRLADRRAALTQLQMDAEAQIIHRLSAFWRQGTADLDHLAEVYERLRGAAIPGLQTRWTQAGLPGPSILRERNRYRPNCEDGSWYSATPYAEVRPLEGQAVVYVLYDANGQACYVGSTQKLHARLASHRRDKDFTSWRAWPCLDREDAYRREVEMLRQVMPYLNRKAAR